MTIPDGLEENVRAFVGRNLAAARQCRDVINELDELLATSFRGRAAEKVLEMIDELGEIETETDALGMQLAESLFAIEKNLDPLEVFYWYELIHMIGKIADQSENVGDRIRLLIGG